MRPRAESLFGSEDDPNDGASRSATLTLAAEVEDGGLDEEAMNLAQRGVAGWTKAGFIARGDLINERKSMTDEFKPTLELFHRASLNSMMSCPCDLVIPHVPS